MVAMILLVLLVLYVHFIDKFVVLLSQIKQSISITIGTDAPKI